jgi:hypothetical protein
MSSVMMIDVLYLPRVAITTTGKEHDTHLKHPCVDSGQEREVTLCCLIPLIGDVVSCNLDHHHLKTSTHQPPSTMTTTTTTSL